MTDFHCHISVNCGYVCLLSLTFAKNSPLCGSTSSGTIPVILWTTIQFIFMLYRGFHFFFNISRFGNLF
jgi:hypothetical protein